MSNNSLLTCGDQFLGSDERMSLKENLARIRKQRGLSQKGLADELGVRQNTIAAIESGKSKRTKYLPDIAKALRVSITDLDPDIAPAESLIIPGSDLVGLRDLPVFASAEAGDGTLVVSNEPVDQVRRPAPLATVKGGYGVIVVGESMMPLLRPGDTALVHPHLPAKQEDLCLFRSEKHGEFLATIKEYVGQTKEVWKVKRYSPKELIFTLPKKDWPQCHVIVGKYNRR